MFFISLILSRLEVIVLQDHEHRNQPMSVTYSQLTTESFKILIDGGKPRKT